jgi:hypothetical protein
MEFRGVVFADGGGNAALGITGVTVIYAALGDNQHSSLFPRQQGGVQAANPAPHYNIVIMVHMIPDITARDIPGLYSDPFQHFSGNDAPLPFQELLHGCFLPVRGGRAAAWATL